MKNEVIYQKAVAELFHKAYGGLADRDVTVAVELFDRLLDRGITTDIDILKGLCKKAGFDNFTCDKLAQVYDYVDIYRKYKNGKEIRRWTDKMIDDLLH